jgi:uncharacterized membrane protein YsdA (DUF1294 family)
LFGEGIVPNGVTRFSNVFVAKINRMTQEQLFVSVVIGGKLHVYSGFDLCRHVKVDCDCHLVPIITYITLSMSTIAVIKGVWRVTIG